MKEVRVYELKVKHDMVPEAQDNYEFQLLHQQRHDFVSRKEGSDVQMLYADKKVIHIQEFHSGNLPDLTVNMAFVGSSLGRFDVNREYIVIDYDLEELLFTAKWKPLIEREQEDHKDTKNAFAAYKDMVKGWWDMPWYKRVWSALKG